MSEAVVSGGLINYYSNKDIPQGSPEWHNIRAGLITGTDAFALLNGKSREQILADKTNNSFKGNYYTRRGHILEGEAREIYSQIYEKVNEMGFITNDLIPWAGYSPDGLIGKDGLWECKSFLEKRHLYVYENLDAAIIAQIQFGLMVTEREWCDLTLYNPDIEDISKQFLVKRIFKNPEIHKRFQENALKNT